MRWKRNTGFDQIEDRRGQGSGASFGFPTGGSGSAIPIPLPGKAGGGLGGIIVFVVLFLLFSGVMPWDHAPRVAILQEHPPTPSTVVPRLRSALTSRVIVEQAKGFLREMLDVPVEEAFSLLRTYARAQGEHLTDVSRRLMTDRYSRPMLVAALAELADGPPH